MKTEDADQFRSWLRGMGRLYGAEPDAVILDAYWIALKDWTLADFGAACQHLMRTAKFMPRPSEFNDIRKASRMTAGEAWSAALEYARGNAPRPTDPLIWAAVHSIGGFNAIRMSNTDATPFLERRFAEHYESIQDAEAVRASLPEIAGERRHLSGPTPIAKLLWSTP